MPNNQRGGTQHGSSEKETECDGERQKSRTGERLKTRKSQVAAVAGERKSCPCGHVIPLL